MNEPRPRFTAAARIVLTALALIALVVQTAWAQQPGEQIGAMDNTGAGGSRWGVGVGLGFERKPYRSFDDKARVLPLIMYVNKYVSVLGPGVDVHLPWGGPVSFRLRARYSFDGYEAEDSPYLAGMDERKDGFWLGGAAMWRSEIANLTAELLTDASGNSDGTKFKLQIDRRFSTGVFGLTPRVSAQRLDKKYVDYYYGVRPNEARTDRARYEGRSAVNVEVGLRVDYAVAPKQDLFIDVSATRLGSGIRDSPLVERSGATAVRVGYLYRF